ncbi:hypothetical protein GCM10018962_82950 [Dactylosporangium matsuzakiense]|uniref:Uncharacterized protein n=1 Tax=Dactylosporangium matsuzakiense TaxID=53360 RepID=A0A9W6KCI8_9ACTN|nr:hypothetical protein Dmats_12725 [Dactylosporangium matsuzakiense]GLK98371.1 hypothetical protein GCM10017581_001120 [Dactylosporangium matsuzakiense]
MGDDWRDQRARAVAHHGAELNRRREAEAARAQELIAEFIAAAQRANLTPEPLRARSYSGRSYRTPLRGWYLNPARTIAISEEGEYYSLLVPSSARALIAGADPSPSAPRLIVGEGARDGESMPLADLLQRLLKGSG